MFKDTKKTNNPTKKMWCKSKYRSLKTQMATKYLKTLSTFLVIRGMQMKLL